jgi:hypothetical protein
VELRHRHDHLVVRGVCIPEFQGQNALFRLP